MNYQDAIEKAKQGKTLMLPHLEAYFKWDYRDNVLKCDRHIYEDLSSRNDWYYIV